MVLVLAEVHEVVLGALVAARGSGPEQGRPLALWVLGVEHGSRDLTARFVDDVRALGRWKTSQGALENDLVGLGIAHFHHRGDAFGDVVVLLVHLLAAGEPLDQVRGQDRAQSTGIIESVVQAGVVGWLRPREVEPLDQIRAALEAGKCLRLGFEAFHHNDNADSLRQLHEEVE